ncbi:MAG: hypothetical protein JWO33_277 [Caulobacteraceae bacterium]|nr:hypothetical protein [Caulobacteraceae bacterium]
MSRYFFHLDGHESVIDDEGLELPDHQHAKMQALHTMGEMLRFERPNFWDTRQLKMIVTDQSGLILFVLDLSAIEAPAIASANRKA